MFFYISFTLNTPLAVVSSTMEALFDDGLVKSSIYVVLDLKRRFAAPHVLSNRHFICYAANRAFRGLRSYPALFGRQIDFSWI